jgi:hypothetical protein
VHTFDIANIPFELSDNTFKNNSLMKPPLDGKRRDSNKVLRTHSSMSEGVNNNIHLDEK